MTQKEAFAILKKGHNVYLTGAAGSGKTYLLNQFISHSRSRGKNVGITASTGIAATHIGGLTIHSWAGMGIMRQAKESEIKAIAAERRIARRFIKTDILVIDEISMLDADRFSLVDQIAKAARGSTKSFGGMQVILCGDFFQLPPVAKEGESPPQLAYHASAWKALDLKVCYLTEQFRQGNDVLLAILAGIRRARVDEKMRNHLRSRKNTPVGSARITKLYSHNVDVDAENARELDRLKKEENSLI